MTEKELIAKYVPSYVNPENPSSSADVSGFSVYEILYGKEGVYGLLNDSRREISTLIKYFGTIDEATDIACQEKKYLPGGYATYKDYIIENQSLSIHDYYMYVKRRMTEADANK